MEPWTKACKRLSWELLIIFQKKPFYPICLLESSVSWDREGKHVIGWMSFPILSPSLGWDFTSTTFGVWLWTWPCDCFGQWMLNAHDVTTGFICVCMIWLALSHSCSLLWETHALGSHCPFNLGPGMKGTWHRPKSDLQPGAKLPRTTHGPEVRNARSLL